MIINKQGIYNYLTYGFITIHVHVVYCNTKSGDGAVMQTTYTCLRKSLFKIRVHKVMTRTCS